MGAVHERWLRRAGNVTHGEEDTAAAPASTTTFALQVIAEDLIAPIVASLVTILSPQDKTSTPLTNSDTTSSCMASSEQASGGAGDSGSSSGIVGVKAMPYAITCARSRRSYTRALEHAQLPSVPLKRLHEAERLLLSQRGVTCFADLGLAEVSFPAFLSKHAEELQPLETTSHRR